MQKWEKTSEEMVCLTTEPPETEGGLIVEMQVYQADQSQLLHF